MPKEISSWDKPSWEWQPSLLDPGIVILRFPGWIFSPYKSEGEYAILNIRLLSPKERDSLEAFMLPLDFMGFSQRLISLSLVDEKGNRLIPEADEGELSDGSSTLVFALAHAILAVNGMLPPPDQNVDHGKLVSIESIKNTLRKEYPSWSQEKIDGCIEFMSHLRFAQPVFSFQRSYKNKYRPGSKVRNLLIPHFPEAGDERIAAAERFIGSRSPMPKGRIAQHRAEIWDAFGITNYAEEKELIKQLGIESIFPVVARLREKLGIWTSDEEMLEKAWSELRKETTLNALPYEGVEDEDGKETWRKKKTPDDPEIRRRHEETVAHQLAATGVKGRPSTRGEDGDFQDDDSLSYFADPFSGIDTALAEEEAAISAKVERERRLGELTPKQRRYLNAILTAKGNMVRAAKILGIKPKSLEQAIRRITKGNNTGL